MFKTLASVVLVLLMAPLALAQDFQDVTELKYKMAIDWTLDHGITHGYGNGYWGPDECVKRGEMLKMLFSFSANNMEYQPTDPSTPSKFSDVPDDSQWLPYIDAAEKSGLIKGYLDGTFRPENCVNRIEAMKLAYIAMVPNTVSLETPPSLLTYDGKPITDMNPMYWYGSIADYMFKNRLVDSTQTLHDPEKYSEDFEAIKFFPEGSMTRKEAAHMMWEIARTHYPDRYLRWCSGWMKENFQLFHSDPESK